MVVFSNSVSRRIEQDGSGYTVHVDILEPGDGDDDPLRQAGYKSDTPLYSVFTGGQVYSDHDPYRLVREADGIDRWVIDELEKIGDRMTGTDDRRHPKQIVADLHDSDDKATKERIIAEGVDEGYTKESMHREFETMRNGGHIYLHDGEYRVT